MFNRITSLILSVLLLALLGSQTAYFVSQPNYFLLAGAIVGLITIASFFNYKRLGFSWPHLLLPAIYLLGISMVFMIITNPRWQVIFLFFAALVLYILEMRLGRESHFLQNIFLLSVFAWYMGLFAAHFYFNLPGWILAILVFGATYLFAVQGFAGFTQPVKKYFYIVLALVCTEAAWGLSLWPTYFPVNAVVLFCIFYLLWLFSFSAFFGKLSPAKIYLQVALIIIVLVITLSTSAWQTIR